MSCRVHARHQKSGYEYWFEYSDWGVALADGNRLADAGFVGVTNGSAPVRESETRQQMKQWLQILEHIQAQAQLTLERERRLLTLLEQAQAQNALALERESHLLRLLEQAQTQSLSDGTQNHLLPLAAAPPSASPVVASDQPASGLRAPMPARWEAVLRHMQQHPGAHHPREVMRELGIEHGTPDVMRKVMQRMAQRGLLVRTGTDGCCQLATSQWEGRGVCVRTE
jgi:hypothetical protein